MARRRPEKPADSGEATADRWMARLRSEIFRMRMGFSQRVMIARTARLRTRVIVRGHGMLKIGEHAVLGDRDAGMPQAPIYLCAREPASVIEIGAHARIGNGAEMIARERIEICEQVLIGAGARILDSDFHGVAPEDRAQAGRSGAVRIGDRAWIGMAAIVLKGVEIGEDAVVGAGSVVERSVRAGAVVAGHPARTLAVYAEASSAAR